ncbi:MAG: glutamate-1-semialdehyde 2,1-aminomutase [Candidatus Omnitrophica bacterium]|nr:glutamate-1-semialdehyde 2,1-aminomutase [Candidatus Omnitrophota bacterium]
MTNQKCFEEAKKYITGGVNSPVRSFKAVGGEPFFVTRGEGATLRDVEGNDYIDYVCSWGAMILGHRHPAIISAVKKALKNGTSFGTPTPLETRLAQMIAAAFPSMARMRFVSSGTEAVMSAVRVARAYTGRTKILKFDGAYHGHADYLLSQAGSGLATLGVPASHGVPENYARDTITIPFNDIKALEHAIQTHRKELACVIVEPYPANIGLLIPATGFLQKLRALTAQEKIILIFDEVISGFRLEYGGAQTLLHIQPDLTCLGKIIGGGFPAAAYGGRQKLMELVAPLGPVYQAGTLSGHPIAMIAGIATLKALQVPGFYKKIAARAEKLVSGLREEADHFSIPLTVNQAGSLFSPFFTRGPVNDAAAARRSDTAEYARLFNLLRRHGVYAPPSQFEAWFVSSAHTARDIEKTVSAVRAAFKEMS